MHTSIMYITTKNILSHNQGDKAPNLIKCYWFVGGEVFCSIRFFITSYDLCAFYRIQFKALCAFLFQVLIATWSYMQYETDQHVLSRAVNQDSLSHFMIFTKKIKPYSWYCTINYTLKFCHLSFAWLNFPTSCTLKTHKYLVPVVTHF